MGLRAEAEAALSFMLEDQDAWGWPIILTDPAETSKPMTGTSTDIGQVIDPETGMVVSGRLASVALRISTILSLGFTEIPRGIRDESSKPWLVTFDDIGGSSWTFKVIQTAPDRAAGLVICHLELYNDA